MPAIPTPDTVTAAFLTEQLRAAGHDGVEVRGFEGRRIGTGQIGQCIRYELDLAHGDGSAPRRLVGKFPSDDPKSRQTGVQLRNFLKEVSFYRELQPRLGIRTPRCYFAAIEGEGPEFMLLLEDLAPAEQGDQLRGCSPEVARAAVLELAGLHAPSWCDASLRGIDWLGEPSDATVQLGRAMYGVQLPAFLERYRERLEADEIDIIERVAASQGPPFELLGDVFSLVHIDYRLDNLMIDERQSPPSVAVVDWQSVTLANPLVDVAYFMGAGLQPEARRSVEREIVRDYHHAICEAGVTGYDAERCWSDYRRGVFSGFAVTVIASVMVQQTERGDEMFTAMARRHARHALDLGADEFLVG
ncbi:MAG: phosphotransferase [Deltaproteobacteria bacterium]|nr:phosphotransferase [Deltaproteobacteria bacterium]